MNQLQTLISSDQTKLGYRLWPGEGPVVVFLPGYKSDMSGTKANMLSNFCKQNGQACLLFDYSGHGVSQGEFIDGTIGRWTQDAIEVIRHAVDERPVVLVGSSMGGWVMLLAAIELKQQVAAMLGIAVAPDFTEELMWNGFSESQRQELKSKGVIYLPSEYEEPFPVSYAAILDGRENLLLNAEIDISCPSGFIHGMCDEDVPWETSLRTISRLKANDVELRLLKNGDHRLSSDDQLKIIQQMLLDILNKIN